MRFFFLFLMLLGFCLQAMLPRASDIALPCPPQGASVSGGFNVGHAGDFCVAVALPGELAVGIPVSTQPIPVGLEVQIEAAGKSTRALSCSSLPLSHFGGNVNVFRSEETVPLTPGFYRVNLTNHGQVLPGVVSIERKIEGRKVVMTLLSERIATFLLTGSPIAIGFIGLLVMEVKAFRKRRPSSPVPPA